MEDAAIVVLYWARDEQALAETATKFGAYCRKIADNILHSAHDVEECENDTWLAAWNSMPDNRPPTWGASPATWRWTGWTKLPPKSAAAGRPLPHWMNWPSAWPPPAAWRTISTPPRPGGSSASFCAPCPRRPAIFSCGGTGTAMPPPTLQRVTT